MNCSDFDDIVPDLGRPGAVSAEDSAAALIHAESCGRCAALLTETESLELSLRKLALRDSHWQPPARIEELLLCEFRRTRNIPGRRGVRRQFPAIAAAAVILLALGISFRHEFVKPSNTDRVAKVTATSPQVTSSSTPPAESQSAQPAAKQSSGSRAAASSSSPKKVAGSESEEVFMALPYADFPENLEGGAIVRMNLSRAALASFGLPVSDVGDAEPIPADVIVSADGTPQAVRLVSQNVTPENISEK